MSSQGVPMAGKQFKDISAVATTLTVDPITPNILISQLNHNCGYEVIPNFKETLLYDPWEMVFALLPHSQKVLLDICLPYQLPPKPNQPLGRRVLARYIMLRQRLIGIRVCTDEKCYPRYQVQKVPLPKKLMAFYRQKQIKVDQEYMMVGEFYLGFLNCSIAMLFQSEIVSNYSILNGYYGYGCEIFSVVADKMAIPSQVKQSMKVVEQLKSLSYDRAVAILYCGCKLVQSPTKVYYTNGFVMQGKIINEQKEYQIFKPACQKLDINLAKASEGKFRYRNQLNSGMFTSEHAIERLEANCRVPTGVPLVQAKAEQEIKTLTFKRNLSRDQSEILYLWYLFQTVNREQPFTLGIPLLGKSKYWYERLIQLTKYINKPVDYLIRLYKRNISNDEIVDEKEKNIFVYNSFKSLIDDQTTKYLAHKQEKIFSKFIPLYTDNQEIRTIKNNQQLYQESNPITIILCDIFLQQFMNAPIQKKTVEETYLQRVCKFVIESRMDTVSQIYEHLYQLRLSVKQIKYFFIKLLPKKISTALKMIPLYFWLLNATAGEINALLEETDIARRMLPSQPISAKSSVIDLESPTFAQKSSKQNEPTLKQKIQKCKAYRRKYLLNFCCHRCQQRFPSYLQQQCLECKESLCCECLGQQTGSKIRSFSDYKCHICAKLCSCKKCVTKLSSNQNQNNYEQPKQIINNEIQERLDCPVCQLLGSNERRTIFIECNICNTKKCYNCVRKQVSGKNTMKYWLCESCISRKQASRIIEQQKIETAQNFIQMDNIQPIILQNRQITENKTSQDNQSRERKKITEKSSIAAQSQLKLQTQSKKTLPKFSASSHRSLLNRSRSRSRHRQSRRDVRQQSGSSSFSQSAESAARSSQPRSVSIKQKHLGKKKSKHRKDRPESNQKSLLKWMPIDKYESKRKSKADISRDSAQRQRQRQKNVRKHTVNPVKNKLDENIEQQVRYSTQMRARVAQVEQSLLHHQLEKQPQVKFTSSELLQQYQTHNNKPSTETPRLWSAHNKEKQFKAQMVSKPNETTEQQMQDYRNDYSY